VQGAEPRRREGALTCERIDARGLSGFASRSFKYYKFSPYHATSLDRAGTFVARTQFFAQRARQLL